MSAKPRRVVAELGRPETPEESAARQAQARALRRSRQTTKNLILSLGATVLLVLVIIWAVPRGNEDPVPRSIDYAETAEEAQGGYDVPLAVPDLPDGWNANEAEIRTGSADGVDSWYIGFVTPETRFAAFSQGIDANESWLAALLDQARADSTVRLGGVEWTVYDSRDDDREGNTEYALSADTDAGIVAVYGTAEPEEIEQLATAVAADLETTK
ncbi:MAG TPA: DUF4245 domain-containing protein [Naasia sp.]|jgi:hypothetical protein